MECAEFVQFNVAEKYVKVSTCVMLCYACASSIDGGFLLHSQNQHYILTLWIKRFFFLMLSGLSCYKICFNTQSRLLDVCSYLNFIFTMVLSSFLFLFFCCYIFFGFYWENLCWVIISNGFIIFPFIKYHISPTLQTKLSHQS